MTVVLSILIFALVLGFLIFIHELGHFSLAKWTGMKVEEFAIGFPPKIWSKKRGETLYSINAVPFGGFVRVTGENPGEDSNDPRSFEKRPYWARILFLLAGVGMNFLFAFVALVIAFSVGFFSISQNLEEVPGATVVKRDVVVTGVQNESPAEAAGLQPGDTIRSFVRPDGSESSVRSIEELTAFTQNLQAEHITQVTINYEREGEATSAVTTINPEGLALGVVIQSLDTVRVPFWRAPAVAWKESVAILDLTWDALGNFFSRLFTQGELDENVSGPVGIYQAVATAAKVGFAQLIFVMVILSLNLALLNLMPFPALDGGRIIFLGIERIFKGAALQKKIEHGVNTAGFVLLIGLMLVLTARDVFRLF